MLESFPLPSIQQYHAFLHYRNWLSALFQLLQIFFSLKTLDYLILTLFFFSSPASSCFSFLPFPLIASLLSTEEVSVHLFILLGKCLYRVFSLSSIIPLILPKLISYTGLSSLWSWTSCSHLHQN